MRRRTYIGALVAAGSGAIAGCGSLASLGGPSQDPEEVAEEFFEALDDGDREAVQSLMHSEGATFDSNEGEWERWEAADIEVEDTEIVEQDSDEATVDVTYGSGIGSGEVTGENTYRIELRPENGEWRIFDGQNV